MRTLFIDNRDSFVYNLVDYVATIDSDVRVLLNTGNINSAIEFNPQAIVLSPGPGNPHNNGDAGICPQVLRTFPHVPTLGVCLGHQIIAATYGGRVAHNEEGPVHGKPAQIHHDGKGLFGGLPDPLEAGRYHSLCVRNVPPKFRVSAEIENGTVMGLRHRYLPLEGVQFHPESVLTPNGRKMIENFVRDASAHTEKNGDGVQS
jgi:anthranilate synthase component 2